MNCKYLMVGLLINTSELAMALSHMFIPGKRLQYVSALQVLHEWAWLRAHMYVTTFTRFA